MSARQSSSVVKSAIVKDPVCGMSVAPTTARWVSDYQGTKYYFCGKGCEYIFDQHPTGHIK